MTNERDMQNLQTLLPELQGLCVRGQKQADETLRRVREMDGRKLEAGDVIQCHGAVDMLWMALILRSHGYRVVRGEGEWTIVILSTKEEK